MVVRPQGPVGHRTTVCPPCLRLREPEPIKHRIFRDWLRGNTDQLELYARTKREAAEAANAGGEHTMQYNARKERVIREIYHRAFVAAGLLDE